MLCVLDNTTMCMYEKCRYYISKRCVLEHVDYEAWPTKDCRLKNEHVLSGTGGERK